MPLRIPARRRHRLLFAPLRIPARRRHRLARALALAALTSLTPPPRPFGLKTQDCPGCCKNCWPKSEQQLGNSGNGGDSEQRSEETARQTVPEIQSEQV